MSNTVLGTFDAGGDGIDVIIHLLSQLDGRQYHRDDFVFTNPAINTDPSFQKNSVIRMQPKAASGYYASRKVFYNRINIADIGPLTILQQDVTTETTLVELLPLINDKYGIFIQASDIVDAEIPPADAQGNISIDLEFTESSIIFYGGTTIEIPEYDCPECPDTPGESWNPGIVFLDLGVEDINLAGALSVKGAKSVTTAIFSSDLSKAKTDTLGLDNYNSDVSGYVQTEHRVLQSSDGLEAVFANRQENNRIMAAWGEFNAGELDVETLDDPLEGVYFMDEFGNVLQNGCRINNHFGTSGYATPQNKQSNLGDEVSDYYVTIPPTEPGGGYTTYTPHWRVLCVKNGGAGYLHALVVPNYNDAIFKTPKSGRTELTLCGQTFSVSLPTTNDGYTPLYNAYYVFSTDNGLTWNTGLEEDVANDDYYNSDMDEPISFRLDGIYKYQMGSNQMYAAGPKVCISTLTKPGNMGDGEATIETYLGYETHPNAAGRVAGLTCIEISGTDKRTLSQDSIKIQEEPYSANTATSAARGVLGIWLCDRSAAELTIPDGVAYQPGFIAPVSDLEHFVADEINGFMLVNEFGTLTMHHFNTSFNRMPELPSYTGNGNTDALRDFLTIRPCKGGYDPYLFSQYGAYENIDYAMLKVLNAIQPVSILTKVYSQPHPELGDILVLQHIHSITTPSRLSNDHTMCLFTTDTAQVVQEMDLRFPGTNDAGNYVEDNAFSPAFGANYNGLMELTSPMYANEDFSAVHITSGNVKTIAFKGIRSNATKAYGVYGLGFDCSYGEEMVGIIQPQWVGLKRTPHGDGYDWGVNYSSSVSNYAVGELLELVDVNDATDGFASLHGYWNGAIYHNIDVKAGPDYYAKVFGFDGTTAFLYNDNSELVQTLYGNLVDMEYLKYIHYSPELGLPVPDPVEPKGAYPFPFKFNELSDYNLRLRPMLSGIVHTWHLSEAVRQYDEVEMSWPSFLMKNSNYITRFKVGYVGLMLDIYGQYGQAAWSDAFDGLALPAIVVDDRAATTELAVSFAQAYESSYPIFEDQPWRGGTPDSKSPNMRILLDNGAVFKDGALFKKTLYSSESDYYKPTTYTQITGILRNSELDTKVVLDTVIATNGNDAYLNTSYKEQLFSKGLSNRGARLDKVLLAQYEARGYDEHYARYDTHKLHTYVPVFPRYGNDVTGSRLSPYDYVTGIPGETIGTSQLVGTAVGYSGVDPKMKSTTGFLNMTSDIIVSSENLPKRSYISPEITYSLVARHHRDEEFVADGDGNMVLPGEVKKTQVMVLTYDGNYFGSAAEKYTESGLRERVDFEFPVKQSIEIKLEAPFEGMTVDYSRIFATTRIAQTETSAVNPTEIILTATDGYYFKVFKTKCFERRDLTDAIDDGVNTQAYGFGEQQLYLGIADVYYADDLGGTHYQGRLMPVRVDNVHVIPYHYATVEVNGTPTDVEAHSDATAIFYDLFANCFVIARVYPNPDYDDMEIRIEKVANGFTEQVVLGESDIYLSLAFVNLFVAAQEE